MSDSETQWFVLDLNPYPWKVPPFSPGRKGNRLFVQAGRDEGLHTYKQAIREQIESMDHHLIEGTVQLYFWFWRKVETYTSQRGRRTKKHEADATNMQKATEDALQGLLMGNDSLVRKVTSEVVEQGPDSPSIVVICISKYEGPIPLPASIKTQVDRIILRQIGLETLTPSNNYYDPTRRD